MHMTSGGIIFDHAYRQIMDMWATAMAALISTQSYGIKCFLFVAHDMMFKLYQW